MYEGDYWITVNKYDGDSGSYYYVAIEEIYPSGFKTRNDVHNYEVLKRISECHRDGIFIDMDGVRRFVKECIPFSYERVLERLMRSGYFTCNVDIPSCLVDE